jgi:hypothetical protein
LTTTCTFTNACADVVLSSFEVAVTTTPHGLIGNGPAGAVYVIVFVPVVTTVPSWLPVALQSPLLAVGSAATVHVTA